MIKGKLSKWHIHKQQLLCVSCVGLYQSLAMQSLIVIIPKAFNGKGTLENRTLELEHTEQPLCRYYFVTLVFFGKETTVKERDEAARK